MKRILLLVIIFSAIASTDNLSCAQSVRIERITTKQGLSHGSVTSIAQDNKGFLWFGTPNGLNRYDGYGFKIFDDSHSGSVPLPINIIRVIHQDNNTFWLAIDNNGLIRFNPSTGEYKQYKHDPSDSSSLSHNDIYAICIDKQNNFWVGTYGGGLNLFNPVTGKFKRFQQNSGAANNVSNDYIQTLHLDGDGIIWIGTEQGGLKKFDPLTKTFSSYNLHERDNKNKKMAPVWAICEDERGFIWLATDGDGLLRFNKKTEEFQIYGHNPAVPTSLSHNNLTAMIKDKAGMLWVGTWGGGLNKFDPVTGKATHYTYHPYLPGKLSSSTIYTLFEDRSGLIWVGTNGHGINKMSTSGSSFHTYAHDPAQPDGLSDNAVRTILEDTEGGVWVGTNGSGLDYLDLVTGKARHYMPKPGDTNSLSGLSVIALCSDNERSLWVGTYDDGLNKLDLKTKRFTRYGHVPDDTTSLSDNRVLALLEDDGYIWVATYESGLDKLDPATGMFQHFQHQATNKASISSNAIRCLYKDRKGRIWIGTKDGLNLFDKGTGTFKRFTHHPEDPGTLSNNTIRCVYEDLAGTLWVGTSEGGLNKYDPQSEKFTSFRQKDGLPSDGIYGILGDSLNNLWISTNKGIAKYISGSNKFTVYDETDGLLGNEYSVGAYHHGKSGKLYFGSFKGLNVFHPDSILDNTFIPPVVITDIKILNNSRPQLLSQPVIYLEYFENNISFEFAALSYDETEQNQYAYQLSGIDTGWVYSGTRRFVSYTNLEGGKYSFRVKAANSDGVWNEEGITADLYIRPPLWEERWFRAAAIILIGLILLLVYRERLKSIKLYNKRLEELVKRRTEELRQRSLQLEQSLQETERQKQEAEQQRLLAEEAHRIKTELTNITVHDLKNPLGGIMMYTDLVKESVADPAKVARLVNTIRETSQNMFHLVSNLLKRSKLESSYISLQKDVIDFALLVRVAVERNNPQALHKHQQLIFQGEPGCYAEVDLDLMNDLIENLISNAIKFSPSNKNIWIQVSSADEAIQLVVKDEGPGLRDDEFDKLFQPFQRLSARPTGGESSTGLGLSIAHQIVQLHGGRIEAESAGLGSGCTFRVHIPGIKLSDPVQANMEDSRRN